MITLHAASSRLSSRRRRQGFTLIELLIVIVILAVLAAIVIPKFADQSRRSKESALKSDLHLLRNATATFQADTGLYPLSLADLTAANAGALSTANSGKDSTGTTVTFTASDYHGPYLTGAVPTDPVSGAAFTYSVASGTVGKVTSSATGNGLDGNAYSSY